MKCELVDIQKADLELIYNWRNQEHIRKVMYNQELIKWEDHLQWYNNIMNNPLKISKIFKINQEPIGIVNINNIDHVTHYCEWGFYIGKNNTAKGTGLHLGYTALEFIFNEFGIEKVIGEVLQSNDISMNFHKRLGFKLDSILRSHITKENIYVYSLLKKDWQLINETINRELKMKFEDFK